MNICESKERYTRYIDFSSLIIDSESLDGRRIGILNLDLASTQLGIWDVIN